ncbi:hypothetical protein LXA47_33420, partial [Massilia sp. P8910]|uniref:hypothetical protein n=1 Tax=Massilia antarctica TaxID=2765360 RepID=UPI001E5C678C
SLRCSRSFAGEVSSPTRAHCSNSCRFVAHDKEVNAGQMKHQDGKPPFMNFQGSTGYNRL